MKLNNHGQTLVLFIIFIPIFLMLSTIVIDTGYVFGENIKLTSATKTILEEALEKKYTEEQIKELYQKNEIDTSNIKMTIEEDQIHITIQYPKESIFGSLIGIKDYEVKLKAHGYVKDDQFHFEKE